MHRSGRGEFEKMGHQGDGVMTRRQALRSLVIAGMGVLGLASAACGATTTAGTVAQNQPPASVGPATVASTTSGQASSNGGATPASWDALVTAARAEGSVVVAGPPDPGADSKFPDAFKQAFGIGLQYLGSNSSEVASRVQNERTAGQYTVDIMLSGSDTVYGTLMPNGWLDPLKPVLVLPEVLDGSKWRTGEPWFRDPQQDSVLQVLNAVAPTPLTINTDLVSPDEVVDSGSLLDPKWKGKIGAYDPSVNGPGIATASAIYLTKGADYATALYKGQEVAVSRDYTQVADWVAHGSYPIVIAAAHAFLIRDLQANLPIKELSFQDIPAVTAGAFGLVTLINNAPHPNAARVFANWIADKDGSALFAQLDGSAPVRNDIDVTWLPADQVPQPGGQYFDSYEYQFASTTRLQIRDFYAGLLK